MAMFSERYGYVNVSDVIIREKITPEIQNAICSCFDRLEQIMRENTYDNHAYIDLEKYLWVFFKISARINFTHITDIILSQQISLRVI